MLLYIIAAEILASFIDANTRIKGTQVRDPEIKIINFANHSTIFLRNSESIVKNPYLEQSETLFER